MTLTFPRRIVVELAAAQAEIDRHVAAGRDGRCLACGQTHPCRPLDLAHSTFARYRRLPTRRPGHASRGLAGAIIARWLRGPDATRRDLTRPGVDRG